MKVTKDGKPWYVGKQGKCGICGCEVTLELYDKPKFAMIDDCSFNYCVECPQCDDVIRFKRLDHEWPEPYHIAIQEIPVTQKQIDDALEVLNES